MFRHEDLPRTSPPFPLSLMTLSRGSPSEHRTFILRVSDVGVILSKSYKKIDVSEFAVVGGVRCGCHPSFKFRQVGGPLVIHPSSYKLVVRWLFIQVHTSRWFVAGVRGSWYPSLKFIQVGGLLVIHSSSHRVIASSGFGWSCLVLRCTSCKLTGHQLVALCSVLESLLVR